MAGSAGDTRQTRFRVGYLTLDVGGVRVERRGETLSLPKMSFRMLECLVRHAPNAVSFDQLMQEVWQDAVVNQETVIQRARLLRESIGDNSQNPKIVETVRGYGYRLIPEVVPLETGGSSPPRRRVWWMVVVAASVAIAVAAYFGKWSSQQAAEPPATVAILPFANLSSDPEQDYLADGLTVEITSLLTGVSGLRVAAHTSALSFKNSDARISEIAATLNVSHVLEGTIRREADEIRITAQLIEADTGYNVWSQSYERQMDSLFDLQEEIARALVTALRPTLQGAAPAVVRTDAETFTYYLQGRYLDNLKGAENWRLAEQYFLQALAADPGFAPAWASLSNTYFYMANSRILDVDVGMSKARDAAEKAIAIDPGQADALATLGLVRMTYDWDISGAAEVIGRALALEPMNSNVLNRAGGLASMLGNFADAAQLLELAINVDPLNMSPQNSLALVYMSQGDLKRAQSVLQNLIQLNPDYPWGRTNLARTYVLLGDPQEAMDVAAKAAPDIWRDLVFILASHMLGDTDKSNRLLEKFKQDFGASGYAKVAEIHAWRGERDQAFAALDLALENRDPGLIYLRQNPFFRDLWHDKRWAAVLDEIGILDLPPFSLPANLAH